MLADILITFHFCTHTCSYILKVKNIKLVACTLLYITVMRSLTSDAFLICSIFSVIQKMPYIFKIEFYIQFVEATIEYCHFKTK